MFAFSVFWLKFMTVCAFWGGGGGGVLCILRPLTCPAALCSFDCIDYVYFSASENLPATL